MTFDVVLMALVERSLRMFRQRRRRAGEKAEVKLCKHDLKRVEFRNYFLGRKSYDSYYYSENTGIVCAECGMIFERDLPP